MSIARSITEQVQEMERCLRAAVKELRFLGCERELVGDIDKLLGIDSTITQYDRDCRQSWDFLRNYGAVLKTWEDRISIRPRSCGRYVAIYKASHVSMHGDRILDLGVDTSNTGESLEDFVKSRLDIIALYNMEDGSEIPLPALDTAT